MKKRPDGRYQQSITITDNLGRKSRKVFYGKSKNEVFNKIKDYEEKAEKGKTFTEVSDEWWEIKEPTLAVNSIKNYKPAFERAQNYFTNSYIKELKPSNISEFMTDFQKKYSPSKKTASTQLSIIRMIFIYAVNMNYCETNPAREIEIDKNLSKSRRTSASSEDIQSIKDNKSEPFGMFAYWALYTGLRKGELLALKWEDINISTRTITVNKSLYWLNQQPYIKLPKTSTSIRTVPLLDSLLHNIDVKKKGIIFPSQKNPNEYMREAEYTIKWKQYNRKAKLSCSPHNLRHTFATMLFENNIEVKDAQSILGHSQSSTTLDVYTDIRSERKQTINKKLLSVDIK